ncbi:acyl-ACP--UDP-N-acetylglucosamine O-acyltransferase [Opitutaceae bacterium TAV4]|uniref:acyl-ACP--UDP-N-acetylglucosamine O-acyltransferase n=1 Tax=Geminisphaera colitermitum TaxID=1148786 RepID=UPI00019652F9|nr:acyl-ACP--UDP-N-acetylglucosamine O-acyltransferase [Geminisphaera colitermitum]RRJ96539.1 acyl-ACP--UDP-N-acetylglucosamine O-acyltransferase [Opitutaceae bacterium TAV4]
MIHPTAIVEDGVVLGENCNIREGVILRRGVVLGARVTVHPYAVIGGEPQDLKFDPSVKSGVRIGDDTTVREHVTINSATREGGHTVIGSHCLIMADAHVAHDCVIGNHVILANSVLLAGHIHVEDHVFIGGGAGLHQFGRVGEGAMVAGGARIALDIPPCVMVAERNEVIGLNLVGLRRRGVAAEVVREMKDAFRAVYYTQGNIREVALALLGDARSREARSFLEFFTQGKRGIARPSREMIEATAEL